MKSYIIIISSITLLFLLGCSSSYQELSNNEHVPKDNFSKYIYVLGNYENSNLISLLCEMVFCGNLYRQAGNLLLYFTIFVSFI